MISREAFSVAFGMGVVGVFWLVVAAIAGAGLANPIVLLIVAVAAAVVGGCLKQCDQGFENWMWRHGTRADDNFPANCSVGESPYVVAEWAWRSSGRKWKLTELDAVAGTVKLTLGATPFTVSNRVEVLATPAASGAWVSVSSSSPQFYDRGANRRVVAGIRQELQAGREVVDGS